MSMTTLLEISGLHLGYGRTSAVKGIDLSVPAGGVVCLIGANGAGKTTTMRGLSGLLKPTAGTIRFDGADITKTSAAERVALGIALVPEGRRVFPDLSVANNLRLGAWTKRRHHKQVEESRELCFSYFPRLAERSEQLAGTLSGGEQQMLAIGRALMSRPRLLLVDEASLGLSPALTQTVFSVVDRINDDGVTVVLVEQNVGVLPYADRALIMEKGTLVYQGSGDEIHSGSIRETYLGTPA